jgi:hypothetical protein
LHLQHQQDGRERRSSISTIRTKAMAVAGGLNLAINARPRPGLKTSMISPAIVPPSRGRTGIKLNSPIIGPAHQMANDE